MITENETEGSCQGLEEDKAEFRLETERLDCFLVQLARFLSTSSSFAPWTDQQTWTSRSSRYVVLRTASFLPFRRSLLFPLLSLFSLPLPHAARVVGGPVGRPGGFRSEASPSAGTLPRAEDVEGGFPESLARPGWAPLPACSSRQQSPRPPVQLQQHLGYRIRRRRTLAPGSVAVAAQPPTAVARLPREVAPAGRPPCLLSRLQERFCPGPHGDSLFPLGDSRPLISFQHLARPFLPPQLARSHPQLRCPGRELLLANVPGGGGGGERRDWQHVRRLERSPAGPGDAGTQGSGLLTVLAWRRV